LIFIDSNISMYLVGADHPNKTVARLLLERSIIDGDALVTDVEVFQEILHRYSAIDRRDAISPAWELLVSIADEIVGIDLADVAAARDILLAGTGASARNAIHIAVTRRLGCSRILTFDRAFDSVPGVRRVL
jgi:hypothetical protein